MPPLSHHHHRLHRALQISISLNIALQQIVLQAMHENQCITLSK